MSECSGVTLPIADILSDNSESIAPVQTSEKLPDNPADIFHVKKTVHDEFIPQIYGGNQERDLQILALKADNPSLDYLKIADICKTKGVNLTPERICQIFKRNIHLVGRLCMLINPLATIEGRAMKLIELVNNPRSTRKDIVEVLDQIRKELVGDKPVNDTKIVNVISFGSITKSADSPDTSIHRSTASGAAGNTEAI